MNKKIENAYDVQGLENWNTTILIWYKEHVVYVETSE